jgi:hypothetical protein
MANYKKAMQFDLGVHEKIKSGILFAVEQFPIVGTSLSAIMTVVLGGEDTWDNIKDRTEQLVEQKLEAAVFNLLKADLEGLKNNLYAYINEVANSSENPSAISQTYTVAQGSFNQLIPRYRLEGFNLLLLPLYAQMANLHLAFHREGCLHGGAWGWTDKALGDHQKGMLRVIEEHEQYVKTWYEQGLRDRENRSYKNQAKRFTAIYGYIRDMTLSVLEYKELWAYFDPSHARPVGPIFNFEREIYSDAFGNSAGKEIVPGEVPTEAMTKIKIWEHKIGDPDESLIDTLQVWYGHKEGIKMGGRGIVPKTEGVFHNPGELRWNIYELDLLERGLIRQFSVSCAREDPNANTVHGIGFNFEDGTNIQIGRFWASIRTFSYPTPPGYYMSSITAIGRPPVHNYSSKQADVVGAIFFGFKRKKTIWKAIKVSAEGDLKLHLTLFSVTGTLAGNPEATLTVPHGYKIISGGGRAIFSDDWGNFLTSSYPAKQLQRDLRFYPGWSDNVFLGSNDNIDWSIQAKSHNYYFQSIGYIDAWAIAIFDPSDEWDVAITSNRSNEGQRPTATAVVKDGYTLVGGGAVVESQGFGHLLVASYPDPDSVGHWVAASKDHIIVDQTGSVTAYAIGLKNKRNDVALSTRIFTRQSIADRRPSTQVSPDSGYSLIGGGAKVNFTFPYGNMLTASYPNFANNSWKVASKDQLFPDPCTITGYAIGLRDYS